MVESAPPSRARIAHQVAELREQRFGRRIEWKARRLSHRGGEHVAERVVARLDELSRKPVERNFGSVKAADGRLERADGFGDFRGGRGLGILNERRDERFARVDAQRVEPRGGGRRRSGA